MIVLAIILGIIAVVNVAAWWAQQRLPRDIDIRCPMGSAPSSPRRIDYWRDLPPGT